MSTRSLVWIALRFYAIFCFFEALGKLAMAVLISPCFGRLVIMPVT